LMFFLFMHSQQHKYFYVGPKWAQAETILLI